MDGFEQAYVAIFNPDGYLASDPISAGFPISAVRLTETRCFEFILRIDEEPLSIKRLPDKFAEFVDAAEPAELQLRDARCGFCWWLVEVLFDGKGKMYLHIGRDRAHNLEAGCLLTFLYKNNNEMIIKVFDKTSCCRHYHTDDSDEDTDN
nr:B3 domain-containing protein Os03g0212300-like [Lolium perenne]